MSQGTEKEFTMLSFLRDFPGGPVVRNPSANAGDTGHVGLIPGWGRSPAEGNGHNLSFRDLVVFIHLKVELAFS